MKTADLTADRGAILDLLERHLPRAATPGRFDWLYLGNPDGAAVSLLLLDGDSPVGVASAFPRRFSTPNGHKRGWVLGDFCVDGRYRSMGPAVMLQRALIEGIERNGAELWYDFPSSEMLAVYRRLALHPQRSLLRLVRMVRVAETTQNASGFRRAAGVPRTVANLALAAMDLPFRFPSRYLPALWPDRFDGKFGGLSPTANDTFAERTPAYLNWRYLEHPYQNHEVAVARKHDEILACAVFYCHEKVLVIVDLFGTERAAVASAVRYLIVLARERRMERITASLLDSSALVSPMKRYGFAVRGHRPVVWWEGRERQDSVPSETSWFLMDGDRES